MVQEHDIVMFTLELFERLHTVIYGIHVDFRFLEHAAHHAQVHKHGIDRQDRRSRRAEVTGTVAGRKLQLIVAPLEFPNRFISRHLLRQDNHKGRLVVQQGIQPQFALHQEHQPPRQSQSDSRPAASRIGHLDNQVDIAAIPFAVFFDDAFVIDENIRHRTRRELFRIEEDVPQNLSDTDFVTD